MTSRTHAPWGVLFATFWCLAVSGCGAGPVEVDHASSRPECAELIAALPDTLNDQARRTISPKSAAAAAYGEEPIVVRCEVDIPAEFGRDSACIVADGIDWYAPDEQYLDQALDVTLTAVHQDPTITVSIPAQYRPAGVAATLSDLAPAVESTTSVEGKCGAQ